MSKGLEENDLVNTCTCDKCNYKKALEIIKEKNVWFWVFRRTHNVQEYNEKVAMYYSPCDSLTQEEYDLLKEVLI